MFVGKKIVMKLPANEDSLDCIGIHSYKELANGVWEKSNNNEDEYSIGSVVVTWYRLNEEISDNYVDDDHSQGYESI